MKSNITPRGRSAADNQTITVPVPPQRLRWLCSELDANGIPYRLDADPLGNSNLTTLDAAQPIIDHVLGYQPANRGLSKFDLAARQPGHRSRLTDSLGLIIALGLVGLVVAQSGHITGDPTTRAMLIGVVGLGVTFLISELVLGNDPRRWLFVLGMMGLFGTAVFYFVMRAMGVL